MRMSKGEVYNDPHPAFGPLAGLPPASPPEIDKAQHPFLSSVDDRGAYGPGRSFCIKSGEVSIILTELLTKLTGVLAGRTTKRGYTVWTDYRRVEMSFDKAMQELVIWASKTGDLPLEDVA